MKVERVTSAEVVASILSLDDPGLAANVLDKMGVTKAEWVQHLVEGISMMDGELLRVYAAVEGGKILGYMVAINCMQPPMFKTFMISYQTFPGMKDEKGASLDLAALEQIKEWAAAYRCHEIMAFVRTEAMSRLYSLKAGFKQTEDICMILEF
jgi:hypothetical protein